MFKLRLESIKYHESSNSHVYAANKYVNEQKPDQAPAVKAQLSLNKQALARLAILFRTLHAINIQARPTTDYCWMTDLDEVKGLNVGGVYRNTSRAKEFTSVIAEVLRREIKSDLQTYKFASVIVDGSTDNSTTESEMIYIQTCKNGSVKTNFIHCCQGQ